MFNFLLTLENDIKIALTANHKILSESGWIKVYEIKKVTKLYCLISTKNNVLNYKFNSVNNISYFGLNSVYDKKIPLYHNYISKNYILHNSIEQDADIVIMLYREDYYNEKSSSNNITEFIVAKHRNGPVGTARLFFNPEITTFSNLN